MDKQYRFHEVRKGERERVLAFARDNGCKPGDTKGMRHHLSLVAEQDGEIAAVALCLDGEAGRVLVEIVTGPGDTDETLVTELADRCMRKVQAEDIGAARLNSPSRKPTETIWTHKNWLNQIEETAPPNADAGAAPDIATDNASAEQPRPEAA